MSGLFRRRKEKKRGEESANEDDGFLDLIAMKVKDSDGNHFGEVVSADSESYIIKHEGIFYKFNPDNIHDKFGDLMLASNIDHALARKQGEQWKNPGKELIRENKFYDFTEKKQREAERNERILLEMELARELAVKTLPPAHIDEDNDVDEDIDGDVDSDVDQEEPDEEMESSGDGIEGQEPEEAQCNESGEDQNHVNEAIDSVRDENDNGDEEGKQGMENKGAESPGNADTTEEEGYVVPGDQTVAEEESEKEAVSNLVNKEESGTRE